MIVCSCNMLRDTEIASAAATRNLRVTQVHACLGCRPRCGGCFATIKQILESTPQTQPACADTCGGQSACAH
jgi:bacterioferritin-associated ferredoxin